mmetsp:Transcript_11798/g.27334  ORF Transcript_11798/g.27334 Transcript_11798/m.27334 type:complete len:156 (-) Transcript_11798:324-791(-)
MSKFVEHMRREAFRLMSVTYGMRQKQDQYHRENSINDQYPLDSLTQLLCFEDSNEARETCKWYNITVRNVETRSSTGERQTVEYIFWQDSKFVVPRGPLKPKKMIRVIDPKAIGATRLAICRGQVSDVLPAVSSEVSLPMLDEQSTDDPPDVQMA